MHFLCRQQHRIKISSPYHLRKVRNEALYFYLTNESKISHKNLDSPSTLNNGRCIKILAAGVDQKPKYKYSKFSEPFTKLEICVPNTFKGYISPSAWRQAFKFRRSIREGVKIEYKSDISTYIPFYTDDPLPSPFKSQRINSTSMAGYFTLKLAVFTSLHT